MNLISKIILSVIVAFIIWLSYLAIRDINNSQNMSTQNKNKWVFFILYFPIIGSFIYFYKRRNQ
jgi:hypothetical protein